jgi:C4-type Zn-finger protein
MEKELKEIIERSKEALEKIEEKIENAGEAFSEDAKGYWKGLKGYLESIGDQLKSAYESREGEAELQAHLFMMEAKEKLASLQDDVALLIDKTAGKSSQELDILALKAHLAKLEGEALLEEKEKAFRDLYGKSKIEAEKLAQKAGREINDIFVKLTEIV